MGVRVPPGAFRFPSHSLAYFRVLLVIYGGFDLPPSFARLSLRRARSHRFARRIGGAVNGNDIDDFVTALLDEPAYRAANPTCNIFHGDLNNNGSVGPEDVAAFVNAALAG